jgi:hypothetical protein
MERQFNEPHPHWGFNFDEWRLLLKNVKFRIFDGTRKLDIKEHHLINGKQKIFNIWTPKEKNGMKGEDYDNFKKEYPFAIAMDVFFSWEENKNMNCFDLIFHQNIEDFGALGAGRGSGQKA